jgi:hypothetical protein
MELPIEIEIELSPAGSLKQAALWKELVQLLENRYSISCTDPADPTTCTATGIQRRPGFGVAMPDLNVYPLGYNFLTAQPLRRRTSDGETSYDRLRHKRRADRPAGMVWLIAGESAWRGSPPSVGSANTRPTEVPRVGASARQGAEHGPALKKGPREPEVLIRQIRGICRP